MDKNFNNDFEKSMQKKGYVWFKDNLNKSLRGIQKRFTDKKSIKYFITGYHYNFKKQYPEWESMEHKDSYSFDVQFNVDNQCIDIRYSAPFQVDKYNTEIRTIQDVEDFYEKTWLDMKARYYEEY